MKPKKAFPASASAASPAPTFPSLSPATLRRQITLACLTGALFLGWLGYLIFLVRTLPQAPNGGPVVLSRPQFLVSSLDVVAQVDGLHDPVTILEVVNPGEENELWKGKKILVSNLERCRPQTVGKDDEALLDYRGPGKYILALRPTGAHPLIRSIGLLANPWAGLPQLAEGLRLKDSLVYPVTFDVAPTPPSPGYPRNFNQRTGPPRMYSAIESNLFQLRAIKKPD
jgi:hypothetical protein